jgi:exopolysaccharide biosynthesis WecB/TagA/CpsF family protein
VASEAAQRIAGNHPTLQQVAHYSPPFRPLREMNDSEMIERVRAAKPDIMLVCFGCPKQEMWMSQHCKTLGVPVMIGAGATVDFLAGRMARAPAWMQRSGTEWLFRLLQEPRRLVRRYADDLIHFFPAILLQRWRQRPMGARSRLKGRP